MDSSIYRITKKKKRKFGKMILGSFYKVVNKKSNKTLFVKMSVITILNFTTDEINGLKNEVNILSKLNHPGLLKFICYSSINFSKRTKTNCYFRICIKTNIGRNN